MSTSPAGAAMFASTAPVDSAVSTIVVDGGASVSPAAVAAAAPSEAAASGKGVEVVAVTPEASVVAPPASPSADKFPYLANRVFDIPAIDVSAARGGVASASPFSPARRARHAQPRARAHVRWPPAARRSSSRTLC
jgi:hypothetical protein